MIILDYSEKWPQVYSRWLDFKNPFNKWSEGYRDDFCYSIIVNGLKKWYRKNYNFKPTHILLGHEAVYRLKQELFYDKDFQIMIDKKKFLNIKMIIINDKIIELLSDGE